MAASPTMSSEELLRAVCDAPDDDGPRLVFADWLEANGQEYEARLIRRQCDLAKLDEYDPAWRFAWNRERDWISARLSKIDKPALPPGLKWPPFAHRRGFLWRLDCDAPRTLAEEMPRLVRRAPIQSVGISARCETEMAAIANAPWFSQISTLEMTLGECGRQAISALASSNSASSLRTLSFRHAGIGREGLEALVDSELLGRVRDLGLAENFFVEHGAPLGKALAGIGPWALASLDLASNRMGPDVLDAIASGCSFPSLTRLDLSDNPLGVAGIHALSRLAAPSLAWLRLAATKPGLPGVRSIAEATSSASLRALELASNQLGPVAMRELAASPHLSGLTYLGLSHNPIGDRGAAILASGGFDRLRSLDLSGTAIGEVGVRAILDSKSLAGLLNLEVWAFDLKGLSPLTKGDLAQRFGVVFG